MGVQKLSVWITAFCCLFFILVGTLLWLFHATYVLRCVNQNENRAIFSKRMSPGDQFTLKYVHSVQKTPVYETFTIDKEGHIILVETRVMSSGYGLPAPKPGNHYMMENGFMVIKDLNRSMGKLLIRISFVQPMELHFDQKVYDLRKCGRAGDLIEVSAVRTNRMRKAIMSWGSNGWLK